MFVMAPPTPHNLELMRGWQQRNEDPNDAAFPAQLQGAKCATLTRGAPQPLSSCYPPLHRHVTPEPPLEPLPTVIHRYTQASLLLRSGWIDA